MAVGDQPNIGLDRRRPNRPRPRLGRSTSQPSLGLPEERNQHEEQSTAVPGAPTSRLGTRLRAASRRAHQAESSRAQRLANRAKPAR